MSLIDLLKIDDDRQITIEGLLVLLVDAVTRDELDRDLTEHGVYKAAKRRYFRLGTAATPFGPAGWQLVNLYCETATFCDVAAQRDSSMTERDIAAHLLTLWNVMPDLASARIAFAGTGPSVAESLARRAVAAIDARLPGVMTKRAAIRMLWDPRATMGAARQIQGPRLRHRLFPGGRVRAFIAEAEAQLDRAVAAELMA